MRSKGCERSLSLPYYAVRLFLLAAAALALFVTLESTLAAAAQDLETARAISNTLAEVAARVGPAVVSIRTEQPRPERKLSTEQEEFFRRFFGDPERFFPCRYC